MVREKTVKKVSIIDLGSNSVRMNIVQIQPNGAASLILQEKEMVQLGRDAFLQKKLQESAMQRTLSVLRNFVALCKKHSADEFLAVATAAVRDAENGKAFLAEITKQTGIVFYSISGLEEARLIYKGVSQDFPVSDTLRFYLDIGGGSSEFIVGDSYSHRELDSVKIGCVRLADMFMKNKHGAVSEEEYARIQDYVRLEINHTLGRLSGYVLEEMAASSGTARCLLQIAQSLDEESLFQKNFLSYKNICKIARMLCAKTEEERKRIIGMHPKRVNIIIPGIAILQTVMEELGFSGCYVSDSGLREGILRVYLEEKYPHATVHENTIIQEKSVFKLARSVKYEEQHAKHVAHLAVRLFDSAKSLSLHSFSEFKRQTLYYAGILHDIGIVLAFAKHDEHGWYIAKNYSNLLGFTEKRQLELALLVGSHRMKENSCLQSCTEIAPEEKKDLELLASFLKIAEALDRNHEQYVDDVYFEKNGDTVNICAVSSEPDCLERKKLTEGLPLLRRTIPALQSLVWKIKD